MCMIIHKPAGIDIPSLASITECARSNSNGSGFMVAVNNKVLIHKGLMGPDELMGAVNILDNTINGGVKDKEMVFHFRMATHGSVSVANCHPFPISGDDEALSADFITSEYGIAHNGVVYIMGRDQEKSDTYCLVQKYLAKFDWAGFKAAYALLDDEVFKCDRVILMNGQGETIKWGEWVAREDGCSYSNGVYVNRWNGNVYGYGFEDDNYGLCGSDGRYDDTLLKNQNNGKYLVYDGKKKLVEDADTTVDTYECDMCQSPDLRVTYLRDGMQLCVDCYDVLHGHSGAGEQTETNKSNPFQARLRCELCDTIVDADELIDVNFGPSITKSICLQCYCVTEEDSLTYAGRCV